jgi:DUF1680 family protein
MFVLLGFITEARAGAVRSQVEDKLDLAPAGGATLTGWIGESIDTCRKGRIHGQKVSDLIKPFAERTMTKWWRCEFWGKWYTSSALAYRHKPSPELRTILDDAVHALVRTQADNGSITSYKPSAELRDWDVWGRKYSLLGMLAYYDLTGDKAILTAARRLADHTLDQIGPGKRNIVTIGWWTGMAASSILEPMVLLYRRTGDKRYLDFAEYIVEAWEGPKGPDLVNKALKGVSVFKMFPGPNPKKRGYMSGGQSKAYEMMSCYEGLIELYRITGKPRHLEAARKVFADIRDTEITILGSGSSWERWCNGRRRQAEPVPEWMETCVTVTWIKFATQLLRITGDPVYADEIERATYNALLAAQKSDGTWWCHYNPLEGARKPAPEHCKMHMNCCVANGPRALMLLPAIAVMTGKTGPVVNLYEPGQFAVPVNGSNIRLGIAGDYPREGRVRIAVNTSGNFPVALRIPSWSQKTRVMVGGKVVAGVDPGTYLDIKRAWSAGDTITIDFDFRVRVEKEPGGSGCVAVVRGPQVFALDRRITKAVQGHGTIRADASGIVDADTVPATQLPESVRMGLDVPFDVNGTPVMLRFCDYASAGHTWSAESSLRVWLPQPFDLSQPFAPKTHPRR